MEIDKWKISWKQLKLQNSLPLLEITDIEEIITLSKTKKSFIWTRTLMNVSLFLLLLIGLQGG